MSDKDNNKIYLVINWNEPECVFSSMNAAKTYIAKSKPDPADDYDSYYSILEFVIDSEELGEMVYDE